MIFMVPLPHLFHKCIFVWVVFGNFLFFHLPFVISFRSIVHCYGSFENSISKVLEKKTKHQGFGHTLKLNYKQMEISCLIDSVGLQHHHADMGMKSHFSGVSHIRAETLTVTLSGEWVSISLFCSVQKVQVKLFFPVMKALVNYTLQWKVPVGPADPTSVKTH